MEIINSIEDIKDVVINRARYQKVMLIFDESISNLEIANIYNNIKMECIYNQMDFFSFDKNEIYNGYKLIIYCLTPEHYLKLDFNQSEFVNLYIAKDGAILPFFVSKLGESKDNYIMQQKKVDMCAIPSLYLSQFFTQFKNLITYSISEHNFKFLDNEITFSILTNALNEITQDMFFADLEFLKMQDVEYSQLPLVDLIMINAVITLLSAIKSRTLMLVDVYKIAKDDELLIDKYYAKTSNNSFLDIVNLNYNYLYNLSLKTKQHILNFISTEHLDLENAEKLVGKLKNYCKNCDNFLNYLYLFNIFGSN